MARLIRSIRNEGGAVRQTSLPEGMHAVIMADQEAAGVVSFRYDRNQLRIVDAMEESTHVQQIRSGLHLRGYDMNTLEVLAKQPLLRLPGISPALKAELRFDIMRAKQGLYFQ